MGQVSALVVFMILLALWLAERDQPILAGATLAVPIAIKYLGSIGAGAIRHRTHSQMIDSCDQPRQPEEPPMPFQVETSTVEKARGTADMQTDLAKALVGVDIQTNRTAARKMEAQGEATFIEQTAPPRARRSNPSAWRGPRRTSVRLRHWARTPRPWSTRSRRSRRAACRSCRTRWS